MNKKDLSERDICSKFIGPAIKRAGWDGMMQIREEVAFTKGRIIVRGKLVTRGKPKRADYILYYKPNIPIRDKYLAPPHTTDFGLLYLPTEGLYAEVLRRSGLLDSLQREQRVVIVGPTTLAALLNSLQMGFRTLAIQKRSSEVWKVLGAVKTEFGRFGDMLDKVKKKLDETGNTIDDAVHRSRQIEKKLRKVEALPSEDGLPLLAEPQLLDIDNEEANETTE